MKRYTVNNKEVKEIELEIHPTNYHRRVKYKQKDFDILVVSLQDQKGMRYFAVSEKDLPDNTDSIHLIYDPNTGDVRWSPAFLDNIIEDVTASYKSDYPTMETTKYPEFEHADKPTFAEAWKTLIELPIKGKELPNRRGANIINDINEEGITRTSTSEPNKIPIENFRLVYDELMCKGSITEGEIKTLLKKNQAKNWRCSACIVSVFGQLDYIDKIDIRSIPIRLQLK